MSGSIADLHQQAVAMLQASGAPMTAENLNRASLALSQGATSMTADPTAESAGPAGRPNMGRQHAAPGRNVASRVAEQAGELPTPPMQTPPLPTADPVTADVMNAEPVVAQTPTPREQAFNQLVDTSGGDEFLRGPMSPLAWAGGGMRTVQGAAQGAGNALMPPPQSGGPNLGIALAPRPSAPVAPAALPAPQAALPAPASVMEALPMQSLAPRTLPTRGVANNANNRGGLRERVAQRNQRQRGKSED